MREGKWVRFELADHTGKTAVWWVVAKEYNTALGQVKWFGRWRGYAFFPFINTIYERTCLRDIAEFIEHENAEHRRAAAAAKGVA